MNRKTPVAEILADKGHVVHSVQPDTLVSQAVQMMNTKKIGALMVLDINRPIGIFTERDVLSRIVTADRKAEKTRIHDVMTKKLVVIKPSHTVDETMQVMTLKRCRHLPVMDDGKLVGLISIGDLTRWLIREHQNYLDSMLEYISGQYPN